MIALRSSQFSFAALQIWHIIAAETTKERKIAPPETSFERRNWIKITLRPHTRRAARFASHFRFELVSLNYCAHLNSAKVCV